MYKNYGEYSQLVTNLTVLNRILKNTGSFII